MHPTNSGSPCLSQLLGGAPASPPPPHSPPTCAVALPSSSPHESLSHTPSPAHPGPRKKGVVLGGQPGCLPTGVQFALESTPVPSALEPLGQRLLSPRRRVVSFGRAGGCQSSPGLSLLASPGFPFRLPLCHCTGDLQRLEQPGREELCRPEHDREPRLCECRRAGGRALWGLQETSCSQQRPRRGLPGFKSPGLFALAPSICGSVDSVESLQVAFPVCHFGQFSTRVLSRVSAGISLELFSGGPVQPAGGLH